MEGHVSAAAHRGTAGARRGLPPGPTTPAALQTSAWVARPIAFMRRASARFGDAFTVRMLEGTFVFLANPTDIKAVFTADPRKLPAGDASLLEPLVGSNSLMLLDGPPHLRHRRLLSPPFHGERMVRYGEAMREATAQGVARWPRGEPFALAERMRAITMDIILRTVLGAEEPEHLAELEQALHRVLQVSVTGIALLPWLQHDLPFSPWRRFLRNREAADAVLLAHLDRRRADPQLAERDDVLSLLLTARDEQGQPLTDSELRDELISLLVAGHETTATGLGWAFDALLRDPEALARAQDEARAGGGEFAWADAVIRETLRLRPPLAVVGRRAAEPIELAGYELPEGTIVAPCAYLAHRHRDVYPEPDAFRPQRFIDSTPSTYAWLPFGGGVRRCIGASFALKEMREVLQEVLRQVELEPAGPAETVRRRAIVLAPRHGTRVSIAA